MKNINNNLFTQIKYVSNDERKEIKKYIEEYNKNLEKKRKIKENIFSCFKYIFFSPLAIAMGLLSALFKLCGTIVALAMPYGFYCLYKLIVTLKQNKEWTEAYLGNVVEKTNNEELLYAENENGYVIWGKFPIKELNADMEEYNLDNIYNAVKEFEEKNLLENTAIDKEGNYEEKTLYERYEQYIKLSQKKDMQDLTVVAASLSNYTDYSVFAIEGLDGQKNIDEVWLGKNKNYDNNGLDILVR